MSSVDLSGITPDQEIDLSGFGLQPYDADHLIVEAGIDTDDRGKRWYVILEPQDVDEEVIEGLINGQVRDGGFLWVDPDAGYDNPEQLVRIGGEGLKRLFKAVLGREHGAMTDLEGQIVHATVKERNGFPQPGRYKAA